MFLYQKQRNRWFIIPIPPWMAAAATRVGEKGMGAWTGQVSLSEKSARDFKDGMGSVEDAGKMGTFAELQKLMDSITSMLSSPFIEVWADFAKTYEKIMSSGAAEAAAKWREALFSDDVINKMIWYSEVWGKFANIVTDLTLGIVKLTHGFDAYSTAIELADGDLGDFMRKFFDNISGMGDLAVVYLRNGFKRALEGVDWKEIITDIIVDELDL